MKTNHSAYTLNYWHASLHSDLPLQDDLKMNFKSTFGVAMKINEAFAV